MRAALLSAQFHGQWIFTQIRQRIFKHIAMQVLYFFQTKSANLWRSTRLSTTNHCKVINIEKWSRFFGPPCKYNII